MIHTVMLMALLWCPVLLNAGLANPAQRIVDESGFKGGLIVCVGKADASFLGGLRINDHFLVQGLVASDSTGVERIRSELQAKGAYGPVTVEHWESANLPFADGLVNLIVLTSAEPKVSPDEIIRALAPRGMAVAPKALEAALPAPTTAIADGWVAYRKPVPKEIDDWTHWLHGPDGNAVSGDSVKGVPRNLQWVQDPLWIRHHNMNPGLSALVSAKGKLFYILDEGPVGIQTADKWSIIARDAFNGTLLWKKPIEQWGWKFWISKQANAALARFLNPHQLMRRLVAVGDSVYVTPGIYAPVHQLDAATGREIRTYAGTEKTCEILCYENMLILAVNRNLDNPKAEPDVSIMAVDIDSGEILWESTGHQGTAPKLDSVKRYVDSSLAVGGDHVYLVDRDHIVGLDLKTGKKKWRVPRPAKEGAKGKSPFGYYYPDLCTLVYGDGVLFFSQILPDKKSLTTKYKKNAVLYAIDVQTGKKIWTFDSVTFAHFTPPDVFIIRGLVWAIDDESMSCVGLDLQTGEQKRAFDVKELFGDWKGGHHNCYRNKATSQYIFSAMAKGHDFLDLDTGEKTRHNWIKGACRYGMLPANGMEYFPSHNCRCYITSKLNGFVAVATTPRTLWTPSTDAHLQKGEAVASRPDEDSGWFTYRGDNARSGHTPTALSDKLSIRWQVDLKGNLTPPITFGDCVVVASSDEHKVICLNQETGKLLWQYTAGGKVDSPPSYYKGAIIFGSRDGYVQSLDAATGRLIWRFRAAPDDVRICAFGQIESAWPAFGSLVVQNDEVYCNAGRSTHLNSGIFLYVLDARTGKPIRSRQVKPDMDSPLEMQESILADLLVGNEKQVHMRGLTFDTSTLKTVDGGPYLNKVKDRTSEAFAHLMSFGGFLDDTWFNSSYWLLRSRFNIGHILSFDAEHVYGIRVYRKCTTGGSYTEDVFIPGQGYELFGKAISGHKEDWKVRIPVRAKALLLSKDNLFLAGVPDSSDPKDPLAYLEGRKGAVLVVHSRIDGAELAKYELDSPPVFDGFAVSKNSLYLCTKDGHLTCFNAR